MFSSKNSNAFTFTLKHAKSITNNDIILKGSAKIFSNLTHLKVNNEMEIVVIVAKIVESRFPLMILILRHIAHPDIPRQEPGGHYQCTVGL